MEPVMKYRGKLTTESEIEFIRKLILENPGDSRRKLSEKLCKAWNWVQPNGTLRDMVCRGYMLSLERTGHITLPPRKCTPCNPLAQRRNPTEIVIDQTPIEATISAANPLEIRQVRRTAQEPLFNSLIAQYHYLGYSHPVGEQLKYMIYLGERPLACFAWSSAPRHIGCRDKFIDWTVRDRKKTLHLIAYNSRFLILPWVRIPHLASHLLGRMVKALPVDWAKLYNHPICYLETFVDTERFKGTCYKAANWTYIGLTRGLGKDARILQQNRSLKAVWGYPLRKDFREMLRNG
jgi:hypothetical protein